MFLESFKGDLREPQGVEKKCKGCFKVVSKMLDSRVLKKVSSAFQENFKNKFQGCFKNVLMKFCFVILMLHGSHFSYTSRGRVCSSRKKGKNS